MEFGVDDAHRLAGIYTGSILSTKASRAGASVVIRPPGTPCNSNVRIAVMECVE